MVPPSFGELSIGASGPPPHAANHPTLETSATNASDCLTHERLVILVLTANKDSPGSQTGLAAGTLDFSEDRLFDGYGVNGLCPPVRLAMCRPMPAPLCA